MAGPRPKQRTHSRLRIAGVGPVLQKFVDDRGTHLAAMIAYFAIVSLVPLLFLALSLMAFVGSNESSFLIEELRRVLPSTSVDVIVDVIGAIQERAPTLSIVGAVGLLWGALGLFSVLESAFNIVYDLPNRPFIRQKLLVLVLLAGGLVVLFCALVAGSYGVDLTRNANIADRSVSYVYAVAFSTILLLIFVWSTYRLLTNARPSLTWWETLPGAVVATIFLQLSFQVLPFFLRGTGELYALQAFGWSCASPRLALPHGEHHRDRGRGQLVAQTRAGRFRPGNGNGAGIGRGRIRQGCRPAAPRSRRVGRKTTA